ncbi:MAG: hypothetical protein RL607_1654, partial [Bacteroidota bacterium]
ITELNYKKYIDLQEFKGKTLYKYDKSGNITEEVNGILSVKSFKYEYDKKDNWIKK